MFYHLLVQVEVLNGLLPRHLFMKSWNIFWLYTIGKKCAKQEALFRYCITVRKPIKNLWMLQVLESSFVPYFWDLKLAVLELVEIPSIIIMESG